MESGQNQRQLTDNQLSCHTSTSVGINTTIYVSPTNNNTKGKK